MTRNCRKSPTCIRHHQHYYQKKQHEAVSSVIYVERLSAGTFNSPNSFCLSPDGGTCHKHSETRDSNAFQWGGNHPKLALAMGGSGPPSNTWLLGPTAPHMPNAISIEPAVSSRLALHYPCLLYTSPSPRDS